VVSSPPSLIFPFVNVIVSAKKPYYTFLHPCRVFELSFARLSGMIPAIAGCLQHHVQSRCSAGRNSFMSEVSGRRAAATVSCALRHSFLFAIFLIILLCSRATAQTDTQPNAYPANPLATLRAGHPRLIILDSDMPAIKRAVADDPFIKAWYQQQLAIGEKLLATPPDV
jgi:hypothetical protein